MWKYILEIDGYKFSYVSEWENQVIVEIEEDYYTDATFMSAFDKALKEKTLVVEALNFAVETQQEELGHAYRYHKDEWRPYLLRLQKNPHVGDDKKCLIADELKRLDAKGEKQAKVQKVRREMSKDYSKTFMSIGRRDGFKCVTCGSSDKLSIDHIVAVTKGGTNELENLQLMCRVHNSSKGAR